MPTKTCNINELRRLHYNAQVVDLNRIHDDLMILRVKSDDGPVHFSSGQYTVLGLGYWEPRVPGTQKEDLSPEVEGKLIKRAYSISCTLLNDSHQLVRAPVDTALEFYIALVRRTNGKPPALTPRLFQLKIGDRLFLSRRAHGHYGIESVEPQQNIIFAATGTGEAPHNALLTELLSRGHSGQIVSITCVRFRRDLAYIEKHRELERRFPNYRYLSLTTREPENLDPTHKGYVGKRYLQDFFESGDFERHTGITLDPNRTHVYLCGSPDMIGVPHRTHDPARRYLVPRGMIEVLEKRGFHVDQPHHPGNIHFEKYW